MPKWRVSIIKDDECIQTLMDLGLTLLQAKTYLALATLGKADIKTISKASNVFRQDVWRLMPTLEKLGLTERIVAKPIMHKAIPLKEGLSILLQRKTKEDAQLQKRTKKLITNLQQDNLKITLLEEDAKFIITSEKTLFRKRFEKNIQMAQTNIDTTVSSHEVFEEMVFHHLKGFKRALERGVRIRALTKKS